MINPLFTLMYGDSLQFYLNTMESFYLPDDSVLVKPCARHRRRSDGRACENIGVNEIAAAVASGARTVAEVGAATRAGTGCGSYRAEIKSLIDGASLQAAE